MPKFVLAVLTMIVVASLSVAHSEGRFLLVTEPSPGMPPCEEFFDKWEAPGAPPGMLAMAGFSREVMAAADCLKKNKVPIACEHWKKLLPILDKLGPPLNENRSGIEDLMRQHACEPGAAPAK
jgi:hypothetical protein